VVAHCAAPIAAVIPAEAGIQYAAASRLHHKLLWDTGSSGQAGRWQNEGGQSAFVRGSSICERHGGHGANAPLPTLPIQSSNSV